MKKEKNQKENKVIFNFSKEKDFSNWFTEILKKAEIADIRYNVKGFLVFQPWCVRAMEKMYAHMEKKLQEKNHEPYIYPTLIPEKNFNIESDHVEGFTPSVFWVTHGGKTKLQEKLALRPTSETAFYQMFALWIRSHKDLPFKTYQRGSVFRYETKATRPFLRTREILWIEAHCAQSTKKESEAQVKEDMETTHEVLHDIFGLPFIFFERPQWDKFPGAEKTFAADVLNPDGKLVQQPSTHLLGQKFSKAFNVKFKNKNGKEEYPFITCYGPAISRIFASVMIVHGDDKGLRFPWKIAPRQVVIATIGKDNTIKNKAKEIREKLEKEKIEAIIDDSDKMPGEKFYFWEMKGVPLRVEIGKKEMENKEFSVFRRDLNKRENIKEKYLINQIKKIAKEYDENLIKTADELFKGRIIDVKKMEDIKTAVNAGKIVRCNFCSIDKNALSCAEAIEKQVEAEVRGIKLDEKKKASGKCIICNKPAKEIVYIGKSY